MKKAILIIGLIVLLCLAVALIGQQNTDHQHVDELYGQPVFREDLEYGEDTHWTTRLWAAGINTKHCLQERLYLRRIHGGNISLTHQKVEQADIMPLLADAIRRQRRESKEHD